MEITKSNNALGAEIKNIDLSKNLTKEELNFINHAWAENLVLVFKKQILSDAQLISYSKNFGDLDLPAPNPYGINFSPNNPEINVISNVKNMGKPIGNLGDGEAVWHADMTYNEMPPKAGILYSLEVPKNQGNTHFANMMKAYEELPDDLKSQVEGKLLIHDCAHNSAGMLRKGYEENADPSKTPGAKHPIIAKDPITNKKLLFLGRRPHAYIVGLRLEDSERILDQLWKHATQDKYTWTQKWDVGDLLMWKNLYVLRKRDSFDPNTRRVMHRTQITGDTRIAV